MYNMKWFGNKKQAECLLKSFGEVKSDSFSFDFIERYFRKKSNADAFQIISDKTCNDLDFEELFMLVDKTNSKIGQQYLYNMLRVIPSNDINTERNEQFIDTIIKDVEYRLYIQKQLNKLNHNDAYYIASLFQEEHTKPPAWFWVIRVLSLTNLVLLIASFILPQFILLFLFLTIINLGFHYWNKRNLYQYIVSIPQLLRLNEVAGYLFKNDQLKAFSPKLQKSLNILKGLNIRMSIFKFEANMGGEFASLAWAFMELIKIIFLLEPIVLFNALKRLDTKRKEIENVFQFIGQIDALISIASLRKGVKTYCVPDIVNSRNMKVKGIYHPLVFDCISNSLHVNHKSILLTGSNMSGKTTFIRSIGINSLTALTINTCFASSFSLPRLKLHTAIRISDDLMNDKSYYFEEVLTIKEMINAGKGENTNLYLLDEIFKGTNTVERISAGKAVLSDLANTKNIVFVSIHDIELADLLDEEYELYHFSENVDSKTVDFDYKLKRGMLTNRNAIKILQINGYPDHVIEEALELAKKLSKNSLTKGVQNNMKS